MEHYFTLEHQDIDLITNLIFYRYDNSGDKRMSKDELKGMLKDLLFKRGIEEITDIDVNLFIRRLILLAETYETNKDNISFEDVHDILEENQEDYRFDPVLEDYDDWNSFSHILSNIKTFFKSFRSNFQLMIGEPRVKHISKLPKGTVDMIKPTRTGKIAEMRSNRSRINALENVQEISPLEQALDLEICNSIVINREIDEKQFRAILSVFQLVIYRRLL